MGSGCQMREVARNEEDDRQRKQNLRIQERPAPHARTQRTLRRVDAVLAKRKRSCGGERKKREDQKRRESEQLAKQQKKAAAERSTGARGGKRGVASLCIGGGEGIALAVERP